MFFSEWNFFFCSIQDSFFKFFYSPRATYSGRLSKSKLMKRLQNRPIRSSEARFLIPLFSTPIRFSRVCIHARWTCSMDLEMKWFRTFRRFGWFDIITIQGVTHLSRIKNFKRYDIFIVAVRNAFIYTKLSNKILIIPS